jgi:hypothetical protein
LFIDPEKVIERVPNLPGVYIMKGSQGHVIMSARQSIFAREFSPILVTLTT